MGISVRETWKTNAHNWREDVYEQTILIAPGVLRAHIPISHGVNETLRIEALSVLGRVKNK